MEIGVESVGVVDSRCAKEAEVSVMLMIVVVFQKRCVVCFSRKRCALLLFFEKDTFMYTKKHARFATNVVKFAKFEKNDFEFFEMTTVRFQKEDSSVTRIYTS